MMQDLTLSMRLYLCDLDKRTYLANWLFLRAKAMASVLDPTMEIDGSCQSLLKVSIACQPGHGVQKFLGQIAAKLLGASTQGCDH